jgi:hypothetical protein
MDRLEEIGLFTRCQDLVAGTMCRIISPTLRAKLGRSSEEFRVELCQQAATPISSLLWQRHNPFIDACPKLTPSTSSLGINESHVDDSSPLRHL